MNAWAVAFGVAWGVAWGANAPAPALIVPLSTVDGTGRRFVLPPSMAIAAAKLAGDHDALLIVEAITASGILE